MAAGTLLAQLSGEYASLVESAAPGVVQAVGGRGRRITGTVFRPGRVLVPAHIVDREDELTVKDGAGTLLSARYRGADGSKNLAVLEVDGLQAAPLSAASAARVGQFALALGRTWSASLVASAGIVSVIGGPLRTGRGRLEQVLRADVRVHPLGAGGPLLDGDGRAVGLATGTAMRGLPLFLPASIAWEVGQAIDEHGDIERGYLGISAQPVRVPERQRAALGRDVGLLISAVAAGSPAEEAGVLVGDVVTGFDSHAVRDHEALLSLLTRDRVGKPASLDIIRGGESRKMEVRVGSRR